MRETPSEFAARVKRSKHVVDDLARYSYHTGAQLKPLRPDEPCPVLFRDLGLIAMAQFLRGELRRLAGPLTPLTYLRTEGYLEPYTDYERIGRLVFLRPLLVAPWHSGVPHIYVARASRGAEAETVGFIPGEVSLEDAARLCSDLSTGAELREILGGRHYDAAAADTLHRLEKLAAEWHETEKRLGPLRRAFQAHDRDRRELARHEMRRLEINEHDLCAAWHHLPRERQRLLSEARPCERIADFQDYKDRKVTS